MLTLPHPLIGRCRGVGCNCLCAGKAIQLYVCEFMCDQEGLQVT